MRELSVYKIRYCEMKPCSVTCTGKEGVEIVVFMALVFRRRRRVLFKNKIGQSRLNFRVRDAVKMQLCLLSKFYK